MDTYNKHLLDQLTQLFKAEMQPFKGQGRAKELAYASFKRRAKLIIKDHVLIQPSGKRKYSLTQRGLERKLLAIQKMHRTMSGS